MSRVRVTFPFYVSVVCCLERSMFDVLVVRNAVRFEGTFQVQFVLQAMQRRLVSLAGSPWLRCYCQARSQLWDRASPVCLPHWSCSMLLCALHIALATRAVSQSLDLALVVPLGLSRRSMVWHAVFSSSVQRAFACKCPLRCFQ